MGSPGHRANILGKTWDVIGIGAYKGPTGKKMWTVLFADKCGSTAPKPTPKPTPKPRPKPTATADAPADAEADAPGRRRADAEAPAPVADRPSVTPAPTPGFGPEATSAGPTTPILPARRPRPDAAPSAPTRPAAGRSSTGDGRRCAWSIARHRRGLLGTIVGGVAGFFFGG